jgi:AcrR family transcriptional regulator
MREGTSTTKQQLLMCGLRRASMNGLTSVSIAPLAAEAGLKKASFFSHFANKETLQVELLDAAAASFRKSVLEPVAPLPPGLARLRRLLELWVGWTARSALPGGCPFVAASAELDDTPGPVRDHLVKIQSAWVARIRADVVEAISLGELPAATDPQQVTFEIFGLYLAYHWTSRLLHDHSARAGALAGFNRLFEVPPLVPRPKRQGTTRRARRARKSKG